MNEQLPPSPEVPTLPEKKKINHRLLWLALLGPIGLVGLLTVLSFAGLEYNYTTWAGMVGSWAIFFGTILFGVVLFKKMHVAVYIICLIVYPLVQFVVAFTFFFFGCLNTWGGNWGHSAPDSWVEEQERLARENPIDPVELEKAKQELEEHLKRQEELEKTETPAVPVTPNESTP